MSKTIIHPYIPGTNEFQVPDFDFRIMKGKGLLVTYSDHWYEDKCKTKPKLPILGIVTDTKLYPDSKCRLIYWPVVHFEGSMFPSIVHPMNVIPFREDQQLPLITMDNGQWGTYGPNGPPVIDNHPYELPS